MAGDSHTFVEGALMPSRAQARGFALGLAVALVAFGSAAVAADRPSSAIAYRWVDDQGVVHYGDRVPPQYAQKEQAVLNSQGVEVRRLEAQKTPEQIAEEDHRQQEIMRRKQHDSFLITTYTSVHDIEALRDLRLDQLHGQRVAAEQYVETLRSRLLALQSRARMFKPYSSRPEAHRLPDDLAEDLVRTLNELQSQSGVVLAKGQEETTLKTQFQADIERYQQLHAAASSQQ
jgi:Domain of unknown function (DUF4124)